MISRRLRIPPVLAAWAAASVLGALSFGCGKLLGVDYGDATVSRDGTTDDGGGRCVARACGADECGLVDDGCGGTMTCNACAAGSECTAGRCRCTGQTCLARGAECGTFDNGCANAAPQCGECTAAQSVCGDNRCTCQPRSCPDGGAEVVGCGTAASGCGQRYVCGVGAGACPFIALPTPEDPDAGVVGTCGGGGQNLCGAAACVPVGCDPGDCGEKSNACNDVIDCGGCDGGTCGANGLANRCGCEKTSCPRLGLTCGSAPDGCGGTLQCGTCEAPEACSAAGQCECIKLDAAVACAGKTCGFASDGCRSFVTCGPACATGGP